MYRLAIVHQRESQAKVHAKKESRQRIAAFFLRTIV